MKALVLTRYGGPEAMELRDVAKPEPKPGEVLVRVMAAGLNPVDYKIREGKLRVIYHWPLPVVMGGELAGVVEACGKGVTGFRPGDRVFARMDKLAMGAFAEHAVVSEKRMLLVRLWPVALATFLGTFAGSLFLTGGNVRATTAALGAVLIVYTAYTLP